MRKIPFKVSAKAARLIGRENVSNADGALIELIKNCYDADAKHAFVIFDISYESVPEVITCLEFDDLCKNKTFMEECACFYIENSGNYSLLKNISDSSYNKLMKYFNQFNKICIIDDGDGMSEECIESKWMTIGTNHKEENYQTKSGRVRVGAKGIGRFALDRLGEYSSMITQEHDSSCFDWLIEWNSFEGDEKPLNQVQATLSESHFDYSTHALKSLNHYVPKDLIKDFKLPSSLKFQTGTMLEMSLLRDVWDTTRIQKLFRAIKTLVPPVGNNDFRLFLIQTNNDNSLLGEVNSYLCDDFDYKINAKCDDAGKVSFTMTRNEIDIERLPEDLLAILQKEIPGFGNELVVKNLTISEIIGNSDIDSSIFNQIGAFALDFFFIKRQYTQKDDAKFFYKNFNFRERTELLNTFGGIKIFRDHFRVRPYGELGGDSFDWLGLGSRQAESPAAPSHSVGQWRVRPGQVTGSIHISRLNNFQFQDKSSREGIQHNDTFDAFKRLICSIIEIFENDRQKIARIFDNYYKSKNRNKIKEETTKRVVQSVKSNEKSSENEKILVDALLDKEDELQKALTENQLLRRYGSIGLTISSLAHELSNTILKLSPTTKVLQKYIDIGIKNNSLDIEGLKILQDNCVELQSQHKRIKSWSDFSLDSINRDKRTQIIKDLFEYFSELRESWISILDDKSIYFHIPQKTKRTQRCLKRMFIIDFDSIFNNLIINSIYAMTKRKDAKPDRHITIELDEINEDIIIKYEDTGPGLEKHIKTESTIFEPLYTTKTDRLGKKIGSGLGMWIVKSIIDDYRGEIELYKMRPGFGVQMKFRTNKKEGMRE
jgi:signal transduction histidine kinase